MPFRPEVSTEVLAVHAALVPGGEQGRVLLFGGSEHHGGFSEENHDDPAEGTAWKKTELYDVADRDLVPGTVPSPGSDVFCSGHAFLPDGRLIIAGGTAHYGGHGAHGGHDLGWGGHRLCWVYNPSDATWVDVADLNPEPGHDEDGGGRWYPTLITLGDGRVAAFFGHPLNSDSRHRNTTPEWYSATSDSWHLMPSMAYPYWGPTFGGDPARLLYYPRVFVVPDGRLFFATGMPVEADDPPTPDTDREDGYASTFYDPASGAYVGAPIPEPSRYSNSWSFPGVLLPLLPTDSDSGVRGYATRAMFLGSGMPQWIDLGADEPRWRDTGARSGAMAGRNRLHGMAVLLPTGEVCAINGVHQQSPEQGTLQPELFDAGIDWDAGTYAPVAGGGSWRTVDDIATHTRNYHSVALLLPDGTVWTAGGNTNASNGDPTDVVEVDGVEKARGIQQCEVWLPPYHDDPGRPSITAPPPSVVLHGSTFEFTLDDASTIQRVALIRFGSATHGTNYDQRYVGLRFDRDGDTIYAEAPPNGDVAPPGFYMLWAVTQDDLPVRVAATVRVTSVDCTLILDRSTFGVHEVQALLSGGAPAIVDDAVYVTVDGLRRAEVPALGGVPVPTLRFADTGGTVPPDDLRLVHDRTLFEDEAASDDVVQRITYVYRAEFGSDDVFDGFDELRRIDVRVDVGNDRCTGQLTLLQQPNPYMVDIDADRTDPNPHWLSIDLRVFQIREGQTRAGVTQGGGTSAPFDFLDGLLNTFNASADGPGHPFSAITEGQSQSRLELAETIGGDRVFNYAVARVRYRAAGVDADDVQVMFRAFPAATTDVRYRPDTTYRRSGPWPDGVALLGHVDGEVASIPFFASPRVDTVGAGGVSMTTQTDPRNTRRIDAGGAAEVTEFFGCWLDINQDDPRFPIAVGDDGPWPDAGARSVKELVRGLHQCLVAEVRFQPGAQDPIVVGAGPGQSDRIAQRNLVIVESDNPGGPDSRTIAHPFAITARPGLVGAPVAAAALLVEGKTAPDELFIRWHDVPRGAEAELFLGDADAESVLARLRTRPGSPRIELVDGATLRIGITDATWLPVPAAIAHAIPALLTVRLPAGIVAGQVFHATVAQVDGRRRRVTGTFEVRIPVSKAGALRPQEIHHLSILEHIRSTIPVANRWRPVFDRYVQVHADRVEGFGTDPSLVDADPNGLGGRWARPTDDRPSGDRDPDGHGDGHDHDEDHDHGDGDDHGDGRGDRLTGRIVRILFDGRGCLRGIHLDDGCGRPTPVRVTDPRLVDLLVRACEGGLTVEVVRRRGCVVAVTLVCC